MQKKIPVLNWYDKRRLTVNLRKLMRKRKATGNYRSFTTMRLGDKWAKKLNPGDVVAISISDDPAQPHIIGYGEVGRVTKTSIICLEEYDLANNLGAKSVMDVYADMRRAYGDESVDLTSSITVIELTVPVEKPRGRK